MSEFKYIPLELLPSIIQHIVRPSHLAKLCLVNKSFYVFAAESLYHTVFIYSWHKDPKVKVIKLLRTLASCPHLAEHVRHLTVRDFPRALHPSEREEILSIRLQAFRNCVNLGSCAWTRDGSLNDDVLNALAHAKHLNDLELNGRNEWRYDQRTLCKFDHLRKITLIMPSTSVTDVLPQWTASTGNTLRHLTLICRSSTVVTDQILADIAPNLANLEKLYIVGCPKVTHKGISAILSHLRNGLVGLGLESLSPSFDVAQFREQCHLSGVLKFLRSITLSADSKALSDASYWPREVANMLIASPLEEFHISSNGGEVGLAISTNFCSNIVTTHCLSLRRFSVHRLRMSLQAVEEVCQRCPNLEELFVTMEQEDLHGLGECLAMGKKLRTVHVHRPMGPTETDDVPVVSHGRVLALVKHSNWPLQHIGFNTRVHQIVRIPVKQSDGAFSIQISLGPYENPEIPEQFLVVRT